MNWDPEVYLAFDDHRLRPARDLLLRVPLSAPRRIVDLGCGPGNATRLLATRYPEARIVGIDSSAEMLARARDDGPDAEWIEADVATWVPADPPDLIYSNAALHWLPDHDALFARLLEALAPGGVLAVQMPDNFTAPSHTAIADLCRNAQWRERLADLAPGARVDPAEAYADRLQARARHVDLWHTTYWQRLNGPTPVLDWVRGSVLRPILATLPAADRPAFLEALQARYAEAYPARPDGGTLFPFRRLFIIAQI